MKRVAMIFTIFLTLALMGKVRFLDDNIMVGDEMETHVNVINSENTDLDDVRVRMLIPELGIMISTNPLDIGGNEKQGRFLFWDADAEPGEYLVRIRATSDESRSLVYRYITIT